MKKEQCFIPVPHLITPEMQRQYYEFFTTAPKTSEMHFVNCNVHDAIHLPHPNQIAELCDSIYFAVTSPTGVHPHIDQIYGDVRKAILIVPLYPYVNSFREYKPTIFHTDYGTVTAPVGVPILMNTTVAHSVEGNPNIDQRVALQFAFDIKYTYSDIKKVLDIEPKRAYN